MSRPDEPSAIDELLDRAARAIQEGDHDTAKVLAEQVLALDENNADAEDLLASPAEHGEIRRLTLMFVDLVDSTALSTRIEPEVYRTVVGRYRDDVLKIVRHYEGHVGSTKGDGLLAFFGHPQAHEDDGRRAVQTGLDITREVAQLSTRVQRRFGFGIEVRVGIHRGIVYLDTAQDDVYGLAANLAARMCSLADPGTVAVSDAIEGLVRDSFELQARLPAVVKGVDEPVHHFRVVAERDVTPLPRGPLVGRQQESDYLDASWTQALAGRLTTPGVAFVGEAGIGKSRLAWSAVAMAERSHAVLLQLVGSPFHTEVGLRPIRRLLERRCGIGRTSDPSDRLRQLEREVRERSLDPGTVVPLLAPVLGIPPQAGYLAVQAEGRKLYEQIGATVHDYLLACVRDDPTLVLVEDMHWFDEDTVDVVNSLLNARLGDHVLIVMTSRNPVPVLDGPRVKPFELKPLTNDESDQLITALHPTITAKQQRAVRRRSDGVPLYIEEVVAKIQQHPSDASSSAGGVPDSLYEALFARLRSSSDAVRVVEAAAIIGSRVERSLLLSVINLGDERIDQAIEQLVQGRVLEPLDDDSWRFRHELLREVAAEISPPSLRRRLHSRIADAMAAGTAEGNPDWPLIARHYERAERFAESASAYAQASANAGQRGALGEARTHLSHAVAQVERAAPGQQRDQLEIAVRLRRAFLAQAAEGVASPNVAADFERCLQLCSSDLHDDDLLSTMMSLYPYYTMRADLDRAQRLVESIRLSLTGPREGFVPINDFALGMLAWYRGEFGYTRTTLELAARSLDDQAASTLDAMLFMPNDATAGLFTHLALARYTDGDLAGAEAELATVERVCARLSFPKGAFSLGYARQIEVLIRVEAGQFERAAESAQQLATLGEQHGFDSWALVGAVQHATVEALAAAESDAEASALEPHIATLTMFVDMWRALGVIALITFYDAALARLLVAAGRLDEAQARLKVALDTAEQTGMHFYDAELLRLRARAATNPDTRSAALDAAVKLARRQDAKVFELRSAMDSFTLAEETGRQLLTAAVARFGADGTWPELTAARNMLE